MGVLIEYKGDPTAAGSGPAGALPDTSAAMGVLLEDKGDPTAAGSGPADALIDGALLGPTLGLGALPTLPTAPQGGVALRGGNVMQQLGDVGQRAAGAGVSGKALLPAVRIAPSVAGRSLQSAPSTQGIQGRKVHKVAPATRTLR